MGKQGTKVIVVAGPTASGKSELALRLAEEFAGTVINADSMQLYRELRVLTARPDAAATSRAPHRLYGVLAAAEPCSAARWRELAEAEIAAATAAGRLALVTGGTGLYLRALMRGLSPIPDVPPPVRAEAKALLQSVGAAGLHSRLAAVDPRMAGRLSAGDSQRLVRAWEVFQATGRSLAEWQAEPPVRGAMMSFRVVALLPPREPLYAACDARFLRMVEEGALEEVAALDQLALDPDLPAMKALGVPELRRHLRGEIELAEAVVAAQRATRRYAKRQLTWLRHQLGADLEVPTQFSESFVPEIFSFIRGFLLTDSV